MKIIVVRHGKTDWNDKHIIQGMTDIELNDEGRKQAIELRNIININEIDLCLCSPLKRAKETAQLIVQDKIPIIYDDLLIERGAGEYEGKKSDFKLIERHWNYKLNDSANGIESIKDCLKRAKDFINKTRNMYADKTLLIVSHGAFIKALHFNILGYDETTDFLTFNAQNGTKYEYEL